MSKRSPRFPFPRPDDDRKPPEELSPIVDWFYSHDDARERFRWVLRDSLDELMDGQRTGRWCYQHLNKTERTHLGTAVEVNLTKEFGIENGVDLDWTVAGRELDCKFSRELGGWEIPMEMYQCQDHGAQSGKADHPALLTWFNDDTFEWATGLIQVTDQRLRWKRPTASNLPARAYNRDNKRKLGDIAYGEIFWLWGGLQTDLPSNLLLHLPDDQRDRILTAGSGQRRVSQLFAEVTGRIVGRHTVLTVGQQDDAPKRVRDARLRLAPEGFVVLGHQDAHPEIAQLLGLTVPTKGEWISLRLTEVSPHDERLKVWMQDTWWAVARPDDPPTAAPAIPPRRLPSQPSLDAQ